jgi:hypothetical protein
MLRLLDFLTAGGGGGGVPGGDKLLIKKSRQINSLLPGEDGSRGPL